MVNRQFYDVASFVALVFERCHLSPQHPFISNSYASGTACLKTLNSISAILSQLPCFGV